MTGFIYPIEGYWKWGGGFLDQKGFLDFAGSGVVHMAGATAAFGWGLLLGARKGKYGLTDKSMQSVGQFTARYIRDIPAVVRLVRLQRWIRIGGL